MIGGVLRLKDLIQMAKEVAFERIEEIKDEEKRFDVQEAEDIIQKVARSIIRFAELSHDRTSDYIFDIQKFSQLEGKTGPYLLYTSVRISFSFIKSR